MSRNLIAALVLSMPLAFQLGTASTSSSSMGASHAAGTNSLAQAPCANTVGREPVLVVDWTGDGPLGLMHRHLAVYGGTNSGLASISLAIGASGTGNPPCSNKASVVTLLPATVIMLGNALRRAGAFTVCDDPAAIPDVPLVTVTVFDPSGQSHTYSYWGSYTPEAQAVELVITSFVAAHFPGYGF